MEYEVNSCVLLTENYIQRQEFLVLRRKSSLEGFRVFPIYVRS